MSWEALVKEHLLQHKVVSGILLLTKHGQEAFTYGELSNLLQNEKQQFIDSFRGLNPASNYNTFLLTVGKRPTLQYKIYKQSYCSIYATSESDRDGLAVCNLPYGIMICTFHQPVQCCKAVQCIEKFCDLLRT
ncbi:uncharacterized protein LOC134711369 [Mytilus trossulus]|uniref:uncharacterized protein LOC134711369 n=1 Tax=Mytilus trossulus TaxID=6551 RepID=UPI0030077B08